MIYINGYYSTPLNSISSYIIYAINKSTHFLATNVGIPSHPALVFLSDRIIFLTSAQETSGKTMLFSMETTYDMGFTVHDILSASCGPMDTKKSLKPLAISALSDTILLSMQKLSLLTECLLSFPIIFFNTFQVLEESFL